MSIVTITPDNYQSEVVDYKGKVVMDFWAEWCGPCKMLAPVIHELAQDMPDVKFVKVNVDNNMQLAMSYKVANIPTLVLVENGEAVRRSVGFASKSEVRAFVEG